MATRPASPPPPSAEIVDFVRALARAAEARDYREALRRAGKDSASADGTLRPLFE